MFSSFPKPKTVKLTPYEKMLERALKNKENRKVVQRYAKQQREAFLGKVVAKKGKKKIKRVRLQKQLKIKTLEAKLKKVLYPYIKKRDGNMCISCGKTGLVGNDWHAGHYIKAELCNIVTRYDERNINSQCSNCNLWKRGNTIAYRLSMLDKYGEKATNELDRKYKQSLPMEFNSRVWLLEQIQKYKDELTKVI